MHEPFVPLTITTYLLMLHLNICSPFVLYNSVSKSKLHLQFGRMLDLLEQFQGVGSLLSSRLLHTVFGYHDIGQGRGGKERSNFV